MTEEKSKRLRIAIVGGGVAGISAAHLLQKKHDVTIFEKEDYLGGHTNTIRIPSGPDEGLPVDTGFIVFNDDTYPNFKAFLKSLGVNTRPSTMSFSYTHQASGFHYAGNTLNGIFSDRRNLVSPKYYHFLSQVPRFNRLALEALEQNNLSGLTLEDFAKRESLSDSLIRYYLVPMTAAIWSTPPEKTLEFPAETLVRFFFHHGLLRILDRPVWRTVEGGSQAYVRAFKKKFSGVIYVQAAIDKITRNGKPTLHFSDGEKKEFDRVVIATHADQALRLLDDPDELESRHLGAWSYTKNETVLHTDEAVLPPFERAWSSWNFWAEDNSSQDTVPLTMTYHMNTLQGLKSEKQYCVTLNRQSEYKDRDIIRTFNYTHPKYDFTSYQSQGHLPKLNGNRGTYFCGSYFGYGFHEDAIKSGFDVARAFGITLNTCAQQ